MSFDSLLNAGEYFSAHYLAEVFPKDLRREVLPTWTAAERDDRLTPRKRLRELRADYFADRAELVAGAEANAAGGLSADKVDPAWRKRLDELHDRVLDAVGFHAGQLILPSSQGGGEHHIPVLYANGDVVAVGCGWATEPDAALDPRAAGRLPTPVPLSAGHELVTGSELAAFLFGSDEPPRYVLLVFGGVLVLADRHAWGEGRYLAVSLDAALGRNDTSLGGELDTIAALFSAETLQPPAEGGDGQLARLVDASHRHAVGVSADLRDGLRRSVELVANEVLDRLRVAGIRPEELDEPAALAKTLARDSLRYLYRILFLLYAEARPDLGILPADYPEYAEGYGLGRLGELVVDPLVEESARAGFHLYDSLDLLFGLVNNGHRELRPGAENGSDDEGLRFEPLHSDLFDPTKITTIGRAEHPGWDPDDPAAPQRYVDTRLRNGCLREVLHSLMIARGRRKERGGFISYAQLSINQIGAVYEGLMSYTGAIAAEELYEVAKDGDPAEGSWTVPATVADGYPDKVFVRREDEETGRKLRVRHPAGSFVYRLAGRDRQTSASYYTPESLTRVTVELALEQRIAEAGEVTARDLLDWTICEPALGSGAFLNEAINQVAAEYLRRRQDEKREKISSEQYDTELRKVKAYVALHNSYGVDLNATAVELAEVSLWLNVMHPGLQAPWFGLHLRRGNSLIGAARRAFTAKDVSGGGWAATKDPARPTDHPLRDGALPAGAIHQFLLPAAGWGAVAGSKEARQLAPEDARRLASWRKGMLRKPTAAQIRRLQGLAGRVEYLWGLVVRRLELSQREISRPIDVWGATDLPRPTEAVTRQQVVEDLHAVGTPHWRLRTLMDTWCALWFWPLQDTALLDRTATTDPAGPEAPVLAAVVAEAQPTLDGEASGPVRTAPRRTIGTPRPVRRDKVPLADLGDWIEFAEALIGRADVADGTLGMEATTLAELTNLEDQLPVWMVTDPDHRIPVRFPWFVPAANIATDQGFFHWELDFAHVFAGPAGGFDLQVGNPPWVRPRWDADAVFAEHDPWFALEEKAAEDDKDERRRLLLKRPGPERYVLGELTATMAQVAYFGSPQVYPLLVGTQPDLYRAFMGQVWTHAGAAGTAGLLHPDTHFTGDKEGALREAAYRRLRIHGDFVNSGQRFFAEPVGHTAHFGVHVYGPPRAIRFDHLSWLVSADALRFSRDHDGSGEVPGIRYRNGEFDERPHRTRVVTVDETVLAIWRRLLDEEDQPLDRTRLLFPVSTGEAAAIEALAAYPDRLAAQEPQITRGFDESGAKKDRLIEYNRIDPATGAEHQPTDWREVVLKGIQLGTATPVFKPHDANSNDPYGLDLIKLQSEFVPGTAYVAAVGREDAYRAAQDRWIDHDRLTSLLADEETVAAAREPVSASAGVSAAEADPVKVNAILVERSRRPYTDFYRLAWRQMIATDTERSLYAAVIPPGPTHIHGVRSAWIRDAKTTVLVSGMWSALPIDYFLRIINAGHLDVSRAKSLPAPSADHPLAPALLLRTLRLNCLTSAYAEMWTKLHDLTWRDTAAWACEWPGLPPLEDVRSDWRPDTPLRTERGRRSALVEIDALIAVWLGMDADALIAAYRGRFPVLQKYEAVTWFDADGAKLAGNARTFGQRQSKESWAQLTAYREEGGPPPEGYRPPFYQADREGEMRAAHAVFSRRLANGGTG